MKAEAGDYKFKRGCIDGKKCDDLEKGDIKGSEDDEEEAEDENKRRKRKAGNGGSDKDDNPFVSGGCCVGELCNEWNGIELKADIQEIKECKSGSESTESTESESSESSESGGKSGGKKGKKMPTIIYVYIFALSLIVNFSLL